VLAECSEHLNVLFWNLQLYVILCDRIYSGSTKAERLRLTDQRWRFHGPSIQVCLL